jgi:hypothetical protein
MEVNMNVPGGGPREKQERKKTDHHKGFEFVTASETHHHSHIQSQEVKRNSLAR